MTAPNPEPRWPGLVAVLSVGFLQVLMPHGMGAGRKEGWAAVGLTRVLAAAAFLVPKWHVRLGYATSTVATGVLGYSLYALVRVLVFGQKIAAVELLQGAMLIWTMNIIVFAAWYWRLDAGGPHGRSRHQTYRQGAFLFPQLTLPEVHGQWRPRFIDYLFVAFNASTAFSPTDSPVLSRWAKMLMMVQSSISLTTLAIVAARAVNILDVKG